MLNSLSRSFVYFKNALLFGKEEDVTLEKVQSLIKTKEKTQMKNLVVDNLGECLNVSRRISEGRGYQNGNKSMSKSKFKGFDKLKFKILVVIKLIISRRIVPSGGIKVILFELWLLHMRMIMRVLVN